ncbi:hypothetical protein D3C84_1205120 [compost metagenome]
MGREQLDHLIDLGEVIPGHGFRSRRKKADNTHAGNRQERLGHAGDGQQERAVLIRHRQQCNNHCRVSAQNKRLGTGVAQQGAAGGTQRQP